LASASEIIFNLFICILILLFRPLRLLEGKIECDEELFNFSLILDCKLKEDESFEICLKFISSLDL
jgi:hypothetical protein